jgi:hypothetical protein
MGNLLLRLKNEQQDTRHHQDGDAGGNGNGGFFVHKNPASDGSLTLIPLIFIKIIVGSPLCAGVGLLPMKFVLDKIWRQADVSLISRHTFTTS